MELEHSTHVLDLPPEVLEQVLDHLTYSELHSVRKTCQAFDTAACNLLSRSLHRQLAKVDSAIAGFLAAKWFRGAHFSDRARVAYRRRLCRGAASLMVLAALVRVSQTCSYHLIRAGEFPPLPAQFLQDVQDVVKFASRRNPLVGRTRLGLLMMEVGHYFEVNVINAKKLSSLAVFRTVVDVLASLPGDQGTMVQTEDGVLYSRQLPRVRVYMPPLVDAQGDGRPQMLLMKLIQLAMHSVSCYVHTDQAVQVEFLPSKEEDTRTLIGVRLEAGCPGATSLRDLRDATPSHFSVFFRAVEVLLSGLEVEQEVIESSHVFRDCVEEPTAEPGSA